MKNVTFSNDDTPIYNRYYAQILHFKMHHDPIDNLTSDLWDY